MFQLQKGFTIYNCDYKGRVFTLLLQFFVNVQDNYYTNYLIHYYNYN